MSVVGVSMVRANYFTDRPRVAPAACIWSSQPHLQAMLRQKLSWKRPLFYLLLPVFVLMIFLGFPIPVPPPPRIEPAQEQSQPAEKERK